MLLLTGGMPFLLITHKITPSKLLLRVHISASRFVSAMNQLVKILTDVSDCSWG